MREMKGPHRTHEHRDNDNFDNFVTFELGRDLGYGTYQGAEMEGKRSSRRGYVDWTYCMNR
jgi:hypothetical protein